MKAKRETGIWVLSYRYPINTEGRRRIDSFYFKRKPPESKVRILLERHGLDYKATEAWSLYRIRCSKNYAVIAIT